MTFRVMYGDILVLVQFCLPPPPTPLICGN